MPNQPLTHSELPSTVWSPHTHSDLSLPNGSTCGQVSTELLRTLLGRLGIEGAHTKPRLEIISLYAAKLKQIHDAGGVSAVEAWWKQGQS
jgi:hypothetical protein